MPDVMTHIEVELAKRCRKRIELSQKTGIEYSTLVKTIRGFKHPAPDFEYRVRKAFASWDAEVEAILQHRQGQPFPEVQRLAARAGNTGGAR